MWFLTPAFGQSFLWLTGSCNYLWTTTIIVLYVRYFFKEDNTEKKKNKIGIISSLLFGVIAGWTNENSVAGLIMICISFMIINEKKSNIKPAKEKIVSFFGLIIGFIILIAAPGNFVRNAKIQEDSFIIVKLLNRLISITSNLECMIGLLFIIAVVCISICVYKKQKIDNRTIAMFIGAFSAIYSMVLSPGFPERSWTIVIVYMIIGIGICFNSLEFKKI